MGPIERKSVHSIASEDLKTHMMIDCVRILIFFQEHDDHTFQCSSDEFLESRVSGPFSVCADDALSCDCFSR